MPLSTASRLFPFRVKHFLRSPMFHGHRRTALACDVRIGAKGNQRFGTGGVGFQPQFNPGARDVVVQIEILSRQHTVAHHHLKLVLHPVGNQTWSGRIAR